MDWAPFGFKERMDGATGGCVKQMIITIDNNNRTITRIDFDDDTPDTYFVFSFLFQPSFFSHSPFLKLQTIFCFRFISLILRLKFQLVCINYLFQFDCRRIGRLDLSVCFGLNRSMEVCPD